MSLAPTIAEPAPPSTHPLVSDVMHAGVVTCRPEVSLAVAARIMAAHRIHAVVVAAPSADGRATRVVGVVSDLDVLLALAEGALHERTAADVAAASVSPCVAPSADVTLAVRLMRDLRTTHVVVVDERTARPVGVLSTLDVAEVIARDA